MSEATAAPPPADAPRFTAVVGVSATTRTIGTVSRLVAGIDKRAGSA